MSKTLTRAEEEIMQVLWKIKQGFLKDIIDEIEPPKPHSNTVATMLKILVDKGFVAFDVHGRNYCYRPIVSKRNYGRKSASQLLKGYFEGSVVNLVSQFVQDDKLSVDEIEALLQDLKKKKK